jgi:tetratricopeptide (TPR) repeat protein
MRVGEPDRKRGFKDEIQYTKSSIRDRDQPGRCPPGVHRVCGRHRDTSFGHMLYFARRYDEAIDQYLKALQLNPEFRVAHWRLGEAYIQTGKHDEAVSQLQKAISLEGNHVSGVEAWVAYAKTLQTDRTEALRILNRLKPEAELRRRCYYIASIYAGLGDKDSAFAWLDKSFAYRESSLAVINVEPMFDNLRDDERFANLLRRMNLPAL